MYFAVVHPKKRCSTDSFSIQKGTDLTSFPISFCEVILSKDSVLKQKPHKDFGLTNMFKVLSPIVST